MGIYWKRTSEVYPDGGYDDSYWMAFDPDVRFPRTFPITGDEPIGNVHRITGGPEDSLWQWSMTASLPGPMFHGRSGVEADKVEAGRAVIDCYRRYLSTRPEKYPR